MVFFVIGVEQAKRSTLDTMREVKETLGTQAEVTQLAVPTKLKATNLDTVMSVNDKLQKIQGNVENILKKVERQYSDVSEAGSHKWVISTPEGDMEQQTAIQRFKWNESKFRLDSQPAKVAEVFESRASFVENELRQKAQLFSELKGQVAQLTPKEGNLFVKDLAEVLSGQAVRKQDFVYSKYLTTVVAIVPKSQIQEFQQGYEEVSSYVIPNSAKQFKGIGDKEGLTLWKVNLFTKRTEFGAEYEEESEQKKKKTPVQEFIQGCRQKLKVVVKEFEFRQNFFEERTKARKEMEEKCKAAQNALCSSCEVSFSQMFVLLLHVKVLRAMLEVNMRFGSDPVLYAVVIPKAGKEKEVMKELSEAESGDHKEMYGTKEELEDSEDFFPFVCVQLHPL